LGSATVATLFGLEAIEVLSTSEMSSRPRTGVIEPEKTGSVNENVLPFWERRSAQMRPPWRVTSSLQIYKPKPRPLRLV
jgi:hypothetical protein